MPITYTFDADRRTVRTRCVGDVKVQEVLDHFRTLAADPNCPEYLDVFLDLSEVESLPKADQLSMVAERMQQVRGRVRFGACAILVTREALFGMMRMFEVLAEKAFRVTNTFRVAAEAEAWLANQRTLAQSEPEGPS